MSRDERGSPRQNMIEGATPKSVTLADALATTLNQEAQHEYGQHGADDPGEDNTVHIRVSFLSSLSVSEKFFE